MTTPTARERAEQIHAALRHRSTPDTKFLACSNCEAEIPMIEAALTAHAHAAAEAMREECIRIADITVPDSYSQPCIDEIVDKIRRISPDSAEWLRQHDARVRLEEAQWWDKLENESIVDQDLLANDRLAELKHAAGG